MNGIIRTLFTSLFFIPVLIFLSACDDESSGLGDGPILIEPLGIVVESSGNMAVADSGIPAIMRVEVSTGDRTIFSGDGNGTGPQLMSPTGIGILNEFN